MYVPYNRELKFKARELRKNQTMAEKIFWNAVRGRKLLGYKFLRQKPLLGYIADFYCAELRLVIEIDGSTHYGNNTEYDRNRTKVLNSHGIRVRRYSNIEVESSLSVVIANLEAYIRVYSVLDNSDDE